MLYRKWVWDFMILDRDVWNPPTSHFLFPSTVSVPHVSVIYSLNNSRDLNKISQVIQFIAESGPWSYLWNKSISVIFNELEMSNNFRSLSLNNKKIKFPIRKIEMNCRIVGKEHTEHEIFIIDSITSDGLFQILKLCRYVTTAYIH